MRIIFAGGDEADRRAAVQYIRDRMEAKPFLTVQTMRWAWIKPLMDVGMYDEAMELSLAGTLSQPQRTGQVTYFARTRVMALLEQGKADAALRAAKAYYDVALLKQTEDAIDLLAEALLTANPDDSEIVARLHRQQAAAAQSADGAIPAGLGESVLKGIASEADLYEARIAEFREGRQNYNSLVSQGNLLLLAGRAGEAREAFERAYQIAPAEQLVEATQNVARAIRAEDGSIGRANAWILAARQGVAGE